MTLGKPIVASDCEGNREQLEDGKTGLLVPFDAAAVAKAIARLCEDKALCDSLLENVAKRQLDSTDDQGRFYELC